MNSSDIWWLVLGSVTGVITHALLNCIGSITSKTKLFIQQTTFQYLAKHLDLSAHTFSKMSNGATIPRLLEQIGLRTYEYMWLHEANASANDSVQHGYIRLPTRSAVWKLLAFCHISHFIWISSDLQTIHIVGPTTMVLTLVKMSNQACTRRMNASEISVMKEAFGCDWFITDLDRSFRKCERCTLLALTIIAVIFTCIVRQLLLILISLLLFSCTLCHSWSVIAEATCFLKEMAVSMSNTFRSWHRARGLAHMDVSVYTPLSGSGDESDVITEGEEEEIASTTGISNVEQAAMPITIFMGDAVIPEDDVVNNPTQDAGERNYSLVLAIEYYYAVMQDFPISNAFPGQIQATSKVCMYAVTECTNFTDCVASMVLCNSLVYVCVYNPMTDPPLYMLRDLISNGQKDSPIFLIIILPSIRFLQRGLKEHSEFRIRTQKCTQFVATITDFEDLLMKASTGFLSQELAFVIPISRDITEEELAEQQIWKSAQALLGNENCHRVLT